MKTEPLNLAFTDEAKAHLESIAAPNEYLGLVGQGYEWVICSYDEKWINENLENIQENGNPYFYKTKDYILGIMSVENAKELEGKTIGLVNGKLHRP